MKLEMPSSFTDHQLSFKVDQLKSYTLKKFTVNIFLTRCYCQGRMLYEDKTCVIPKCSSCEFDDNINVPSSCCNCLVLSEEEYHRCMNREKQAPPPVTIFSSGGGKRDGR